MKAEKSIAIVFTAVGLCFVLGGAAFGTTGILRGDIVAGFVSGFASIIIGAGPVLHGLRMLHR